ncbi:MAG: DUF983 domain-containing protein [Pseudomonadota bacterium]
MSKTAHTPTDPAHRSARQPMLRGWRRKCPKCGHGALFKGYLQTADHCPVCREPLEIYKADDGPAYLTILIVGHLMAPLLHIVFVRFRPEPLVLFTIFAVGCVALSLYLLPKFKGAIIGYKWARGTPDPAV